MEIGPAGRNEGAALVLSFFSLLAAADSAQIRVPQPVFFFFVFAERYKLP